MRRIYRIGFEFVWNYCNYRKLDLTPQFRLLIYLDLDLFGTWIPSWNKDKIYVRSSSVRLTSVTRMVYRRAKRALLSVLGIRNYNYRGGGG